MSEKTTTVRLLLGDIRVPVGTQIQEIIDIAGSRMRRAGISPASLRFRLYKRSIDARHKDDIKLVCSVIVESETDVLGKLSPRTLTALKAKTMTEEELTVERGTTPSRYRPLIVGMGPAGLVCSLLLAEQGYRPILIDRGDCVQDRAKCVDRFCLTGALDADSNIQFGAGGAGTFSDGKLLTRIGDARGAYVLRRLYEFGAPEDILYKAKPHVGTDVLRDVVDSMLQRISALGGDVHYRTKMTDVTEQSDGSLRVQTNRGDFLCETLVLAIGHSARDTYQLLIQKGIMIQPKPMSIGVRIEHLQSDIDRALYGDYAGDPTLGPAEYALSDTRTDRGVYTFCMCPGGTVVAAASEQGGVVVNGMSHHARDGANANCAVAVSVRPEDYESVDGNAALGAIAYQRAIERAAFTVGGCDYSAPIQTVGDFLSGVVQHEPSRILPTYRDGVHVRVADLSRVLPSYVTEGLRYGLRVFDGRIRGFACEDAVLSGAETRTSAPVRILRDERCHAVGHRGIYPAGEGAGYAGGITSAAVDGIRIAQSIMAEYAPLE